MQVWGFFFCLFFFNSVSYDCPSQRPGSFLLGERLRALCLTHFISKHPQTAGNPQEHRPGVGQCLKDAVSKLTAQDKG